MSQGVRRNFRVTTIAMWVVAIVGLIAAAGLAGVKSGSRLGRDFAVAALVVFLPGAVPLITEALEGRRAKRDASEKGEVQRRDELRELLAYCGPLAIADPYKLGVSGSSLAEERAVTRQEVGNRPVYVQREVADRQLQECFEAHEPFALVVGTSKAGKSRTLFESAVETYGDRVLIAPAKARIRPGSVSKVRSIDSGESS